MPRIEHNTPREWVIAGPHPDLAEMTRAAGVNPLLAQLLLLRGIRAGATAAFLRPDFRELHPPERLTNAVEAARRLAAAAQAGRKIVIYGDYDVDGVTAAAMLWHALRFAGATPEVYIPSRLDEGYGLSTEAIEKLAASGAALVITVDCGITALEQARRARELGVELIITDHHEPKATLPDAALLVHPTAVPPASGNPNLSGAGVALKIAWALCRELTRASKVSPEMAEFLQDATALAALGLIADVVPLVGENRVIASAGLKRLRQTQNVGLRALIEASGLKGKASYDDYDVGFVLAPRLNAIGRMGHAAEAVELLTRADSQRAFEIAAELDRLNRQRQSVEREILEQAVQMTMDLGFHRDGRRGIVLAHPDWHAGVIGIVASRLVERFGRPTVLIALGDGEGQGSGRSVRHFPLHEALAACDKHLLSHGGHAMAAGLRIAAGNVDEFREAFAAQAAQRLTPNDIVPKLHLDDEVDLAQLTPELVSQIQRMAPFGAGNARPLLASAEVELADSPRAVGGGRHLQFTVRQTLTRGGAPDGSYRKAIAFNRGEYAAELAERRRMRVAFEPILNEWNGARKVELKVVDWKYVS
ncbi:MAG: single-stranded-DNA-specific exonuclease RecJ [Planctomycetes bacterium]|nr:single-stranded-DNA-specific exonuclease RecJ [Planctomycetota bacterium]